MQSPLSKRKKGSAQKASDDGLPQPTIGRTPIPQQGPSGSGKPTVPDMPRRDTRASGQGAGNTPRSEKLSSGAPANCGSGGPGAASSDDAMRKGGTPSRFADSRGRNS